MNSSLASPSTEEDLEMQLKALEQCWYNFAKYRFKGQEWTCSVLGLCSGERLQLSWVKSSFLWTVSCSGVCLICIQRLEKNSTKCQIKDDAILLNNWFLCRAWQGESLVFDLWGWDPLLCFWFRLKRHKHSHILHLFKWSSHQTFHHPLCSCLLLCLPKQMPQTFKSLRLLSVYDKCCICTCVCVFGWHLKTYSPVKWPGEKGAVERKPAECQYQITGRLSAGTHGATELAEAL